MAFVRALRRSATRRLIFGSADRSTESSLLHVDTHGPQSSILINFPLSEQSLKSFTHGYYPFRALFQTCIRHSTKGLFTHLTACRRSRRRSPSQRQLRWQRRAGPLGRRRSAQSAEGSKRNQLKRRECSMTALTFFTCHTTHSGEKLSLRRPATVGEPIFEAK